MKLHSDTLTTGDVYNAMSYAKNGGGVSDGVYFAVLDESGSRTRANAWEVRLAHPGDADHRRYTNGGNTGNGGLRAATYDEWGWFIAELFALDADAVFGTYKGVADFDAQTRYRFAR